MARRQSSRLSPSSSPCRSYGTHSRRLFQKITEGFESLLTENQWQSSWGRAPAQLRRFQVGGSRRASRCGARQARLRKTCHHFCDTDSVTVSVRESKRFWCFVNFGPSRVNFFSSFAMKTSMELARRCSRPKTRPSLLSIFRSFIGLWLEIWHMKKTASSKSNREQSTRSKSTNSYATDSVARPGFLATWSLLCKLPAVTYPC